MIRVTRTIQIAMLLFLLDAGAAAAASPAHVQVYYFHGDLRCATCTKFETYVRALVASRYADAVSAGQLRLQVVNVDRPENAHFLAEYQLYTKSVVLARYENGRQVRWKNLALIWQYVRDRSAFDRYVAQQIDAMLETGDDA